MNYKRVIIYVTLILCIGFLIKNICKSSYISRGRVESKILIDRLKLYHNKLGCYPQNLSVLGLSKKTNDNFICYKGIVYIYDCVNENEYRLSFNCGKRKIIYYSIVEKWLEGNQIDYINKMRENIFHRILSQEMSGIIRKQICGVSKKMRDSVIYANKIQQDSIIYIKDMYKDNKIAGKGFAIYFTQLNRIKKIGEWIYYKEDGNGIEVVYPKDKDSGCVVKEIDIDFNI